MTTTWQGLVWKFVLEVVAAFAAQHVDPRFARIAGTSTVHTRVQMLDLSIDLVAFPDTTPS